MKSLGTKHVYLTGSKKIVERIVRKDESGKCWIKWYGQNIQVRQIDGRYNVTSGWRTVESY